MQVGHVQILVRLNKRGVVLLLLLFLLQVPLLALFLALFCPCAVGSFCVFSTHSSRYSARKGSRVLAANALPSTLFFFCLVSPAPFLPAGLATQLPAAGCALGFFVRFALPAQGEAVVAEIQNEATLIRSRTANIEDQLRIQTDTIIFKYNQETDAILTNIRGNVTVIRKLTDQLVSEIDLQTSLLKAQADAEVASIQGDAKAKATRIREEANAQIEIWRQDLESRSVLDIMTNLNMTAEEALVLRWIEAFSKKKNVMLDVFTPPALYLPGQAEKVNAALGVPP
eukprot:gb/GEZN01010523.1/.p1 GENE.gb/GEZN01010523.1/~~gb/GEZN01010523.1/.p1  ORF type:complete len:284 (-),score=54.70 gb/GEZN01010523.1/:31-882(-)